MTQVINQTAEVETKDKPVALEAIAGLFKALDQRGISYCHWKSNLRLELGLKGQTDLDLLVDRGHSEAFRELLEEHHIKRVLAAPGKRYPSIEDYLGFDPPSGKLFHLHVHYRLVLGEQFVKNHCLPLEDQFLNAVRLHHGVYIPAPELELIVLSLRALLKYRDRDALKDILSIRSPGIPTHILNEIYWLLEQTSIQDISRILVEMPDVAPPDVILRFLKTAIASPRDGFTLYQLRQAVRRAMSKYQRHGRASASLKYFRELWHRRRSFLRLTPRKGMTLPDGGVTVALVGVDGAGKTTLCQELSRWLSQYLDVHVHYMGSKQPSRLSDRLYLFFRIARRGHRTISGALGDSNPLSRSLRWSRQLLLCSHYLSVGYDRYRRYLLGKKEARAGSIVIFDRFPLQAPFDGPGIHLIANDGNGADTFFSVRELELYCKFELPDLLIALHVSPEVSMRRKPDHSEEAIEAKNRALHALRASLEDRPTRGRWAHLNADLAFETVLSQLKQVIWAEF